MTHVSLKNALLVASVLSFSLGIAVFAEPTTVECTTDPLFATNECDVCYTEKYDPQTAASGWTAELSTVKVPWEHGGGNLGEVILESAQKLPELLSSPGVTITPAEATNIWEFDTDIVWYPVGSDNEYYIEKWVKNNLYTLKTGVKLTVAGTGTQDTVLIKTDLIYEDYDVSMAENSATKSRNICVLGYFSTEINAPVTQPVITPPVVVTPSVTEPVTSPPVNETDLNAAGPEESTITPEQTETKSGPEFWIFLLLAFAFSSAWTAWKKQKV